MSKFQTKLVPYDYCFTVEQACPYCGADVFATANAWEQKQNGTWKATNIDCQCANEPDIEEDIEDWRAFMDEHTVLVYEHWHPFVGNVLCRINMEFVFDMRCFRIKEIM